VIRKDHAFFVGRGKEGLKIKSALTLTLPKRRTARRERGLTELFGRGTPT